MHTMKHEENQKIKSESDTIGDREMS